MQATPLDPAAMTLLVTLADAGSLSNAARSAGRTQSALTKQLARMERQLGVTLFNRSLRGLIPTEYGSVLLSRARVVQAQLVQAAQALAQLRGVREGQVCVALSHLATLRLLPGVWPRFRERWPEVALRIVPPAFPDRLNGLREGLPDLAITQLPSAGLGAEYHVRPLLATTLAAVVRRGHPLARATTLSQLACAEWVMPSADSATREAMDTAFAKARLKAPRCLVRCETLTGLETMVAASDLIGAVPSDVFEARAGSTGLQRLALAVPPRGHTLALVRWADAQPTPAAQDLEDLFLAQARTLARETRAGLR